MLKTFFAGCLLFMVTITAQAQDFHPRVNEAAPTEFGEFFEKEITSAAFEKKGLAPVKIKVAIRVKKKIALGCQYEYRLINASEQGVKVEMSSAADFKYSGKLKPGEEAIFFVNTMSRCSKEKTDAACVGCEPSIRINEVYPLK